jgi:hypothetical protein
VVRGGSWNNNSENLRSANRNRTTPDNRNNNLGFRVSSTLFAGAGAVTAAPGAHQASRAVHEEHEGGARPGRRMSFGGRRRFQPQAPYIPASDHGASLS